MPRRLHFLRTLFDEMRRRKVVRTAIAYGVAAGAFIQIASAVIPALYMPDVTLTLVVVVAFVGLPVAMLLSWFFEITPERTAEVESRGAADDGAAGRPVPGSTSGTLPDATTAFIGRDAELTALLRLLDDPACRLITITGPGGVGKTRLALRAVEERADGWRDGVARVGLSSLTAAELLPATLLESFGITPARRSEQMAELTSFLREKQMLILLDNFEQLSQGAHLLSAVIDQAPGVRLLVTSRERLNLHAEALLSLQGLPVEAVGDDDSDAVRLFVASAVRLDRDFSLDAASRQDAHRICALLGGMPLAIELAASWIRVMTCAEILAELQRGLSILAQDAADVPERHRCLRATFDASWRLLSDAERRAAAALAVFRSGFDRAGAVAVADAELPLLRALLDKSLLTRDAGRFVMLDVVRQYARERLGEDGAAERAALGRHMDHIAGLLADAEGAVVRADGAAMAGVAAVIDEVRAAWAHAVACSDAATLLRMVNGLYHFYDVRGWAREGVDAFQHALDATVGVSVAGDAEARTLALLRGRLELRCGALWNRLGDLDRAEYLLGRGTLAAEAAGDDAELIFALQKLGANLLAAGEHDMAEQAERRAIVLSEQTGRGHAYGWSLNHLGNVMIARGEYHEAARLFREALVALRQHDDRSGVWMTSNNLGVIAAGQKNYEEAWRWFSDALTQQADQDNRRSAAMLHNNLGSAARAMGDEEAAASHLGRALGISRQMGYQGIAALAEAGLAELDLKQGRLDAAEAGVRSVLKTAQSVRNVPLALQTLAVGARLRERQGDKASAARLASAVLNHPASGDEARETAAALLRDLGFEVDTAIAIADLDGAVAAFDAGAGRMERATR
jgi:predicted ATPase/Tfp pilus assembly protein PilF